MATIQKRGPYQYQVIVRRVGYPSQTATFETRAEAEGWASVVESEMIRGIFVDRREAETTTLGQALTRYGKEISPSKKSAANELLMIARLQKHPLALRGLASLRNVDFARYRDERLAEVGANTVRLELALFSHLFNCAKTEWSIPVQNPIEGIRKPKLPEGRDRRLVGDEEDRLIAAAKLCVSGNRGLVVAIRLAIETGMRAGEIASLKWHQVDFDAEIIRLGVTKNGCKRVVPLTKAAEEILWSLPEPASLNERVNSFHDTRGLSKAFRLACKKANISGLCFHDLRHEAASRLAPKMEAPTLAKVMGWKTLQMSMRYYNPTHAELVAAVRAH
ncbi:site-specific integrase [Chitinibacter bivalviorum]|uniref:Site-specific integrase n=1 Tax=Chitinibacter bivalviorum TaxID=2739434 RepID=A0A7H9BKB2_9NEIS|nr:site-specific integrase [Chitinibacter bivalviorum]QLG88929.1 site-specific integrase [Chitinibacter bivalviorum]